MSEGKMERKQKEDRACVRAFTHDDGVRRDGFNGCRKVSST